MEIIPLLHILLFWPNTLFTFVFSNIILFQDTDDHIPGLQLSDQCYINMSIEITTSDMKYYISVYSIWLRAKTQLASLMTTCCPPPPSEWSGWTFLVCAVNRNCAFIIHIMNHARKRAAQCWGWSLCVCVCVRACVCEGKSGGYDEAPRQKERYYATIQLEAFFFKCPSVAFVTSSFHVTTRHLLLKFLNIFWNLPASCFIFSASLPFAGPIHSVPQVKGNQRNIAPPTLFHRLSPLSYTPQVHVLLFCIWN